VTSSDEITCGELVELVTAYLEGSLSAPERFRFEDHLSECPYCQTYLDQMRQTIRLLGELREEQLNPEARDELLSIFHDWKAQT
jgi:anti-sigma factor RsiW